MKTIAATFTSKKLVWLAVGCILLVNAFMLGKVYINRSAVIAQLELSERELQLPYNYGFTKEDSSARVSLRWATPNTEPINIELNHWRWQHDRSLQLSAAHFVSFQFPVCTQKTRFRQKQSGWVLLEFNGKSYTDYVAQVEQYHQLIMGLTATANGELAEKELAEKRKSATEFLTAAQTTNSRLFLIDAAAERELLEAVQRERQSSSTGNLVIVPAEVRADFYRCDNNEKRTTEVVIDSLAVESLYIPNRLASDFPSDDHRRPTVKFTALVNYGRLYEPWISNLQ